MELNLEPQMANTTLFEGEGGAYYLWSNSKYPALDQSKVGASKLVLKPHGFAIPHYADADKIGYVLHGTCTVGIVSPGSTKEQILVINKGDAIPVPLGVVSWWFNGGDTEVAIVFLGETTKVYTPGQFTYFFLTGGLGILTAFSTSFVTRAVYRNHKESALSSITSVFEYSHKQAKNLAKSQKGSVIIKLEKGITFPEPSKDLSVELYTSIDNEVHDVVVEGGGVVNALTETNFPLLKEVGLSANLVKLEGDAVFGPIFWTDGSVQISYVTKGNGKIEVIGVQGEVVLEGKIKAGEMFVVPRFLAVGLIAGDNGLEIFTVITSSKPVMEELAGKTGKTSVWKAISPIVLQIALNVDEEFVEDFRSKVEANTIIVPPKDN